jgi:hypothetical protein
MTAVRLHGSRKIAVLITVVVLLAGCSHPAPKPVHLPASIDPSTILPAGPDGDNVVVRLVVTNPSDRGLHVLCTVTYEPTGAIVGSFGTGTELPAGAERTFRLRVPVAFRHEFGPAFVPRCIGRA